LTDHEYTILSLLRTYTLDGTPSVAQNDTTFVEKDDGGAGAPVRCAVKEKYPFS